METIGRSSSKVPVPFKDVIGREGRSSKKLITNKQSMHAVEYNDDLLIEILLRLPVISLVLFKSVCKRWLFLISNPSFHLRAKSLPSILAPCGFIFRVSPRLAMKYDFVSLDTRIPYKHSALKTPFPFLSMLHNAHILQLCNGLLLCRGGIKNDMYYVYNPCINLYKMLPQCSNKLVRPTQIAFDPTKSPHYKVIQTVLVPHDYRYGGILKIQIQTYSSETRNWSFFSDQYPPSSFRYFDNGIYWNDAIYWLHSEFKPDVIFKLDISVEHQALTTIKTFIPVDIKVPSTYKCKLCESRGCLLLICSDRHHYTRHIDVYEMRNGLSGWSVKYSVNLDDITPFPRSWRIYSNVWSIVLGESEEDSFMLIELVGKLVQYKPVSKTSRELCEFASVGSTDIFHFIASFASAGV